MEEAERLYHQALELFRSGNLNQAIARLEQSLALKAEFPDALEALGVCYSKADRLDDAIETTKRLAKVSPNHIMAHANLSRFYVQKGMILEAEHEQAEARRLTWKTELKSKKQETPRIDYEEQIERFKQVIELDPADVLGYFSLGNAYLDSGRKREAMDTFQKAIEADPKHSSSYFGLGLALEGLGDFKKARAIYEKGIRVADERGDVMTQKKMESRLRAIEQN